MSWQDDLRRLDADLAAGRIEPAAHRKQRDELLAQASGSTVPSPVPSPLRRPATAWHSENPAAHPATAKPPVDPRTAPPQRIESPAGWHKRPQPPPPWQRTNSAAQRTLSQHGVVPPVPDHLTTAPSPADITPTRYMTVERPAPDPISRFPPLGHPVHHRPDEPDEPPGKHRSGDGQRPTWLFLGLGVLVVLAMVVGLTAWLGSGDDESSSSAQPPAMSSAGSAIQPAPLEDRLPKLPGEANPNNSTVTIAKARDLKLIPGPTAELFTANGAKEMVFRGGADAGVNYLALVIPTSSAANAQTVVETLYQQGLASGMRPVGADVRTVSGRIENQFLNTSWYGSGNNAVVLGIGLAYRGQSGMSGELDSMLKQFESVLPAG